MAILKKNKAKTKSTKKVTEKKPKYVTLEPQKDEEVASKKIEEHDVVKTANKRLETKIFDKREPVAKNIHAATYAYHDSNKELSILVGKDGAYGADIENLFICDLLIIDKDTGAKSVVSKTENPKLWIESLHKAELGKPYIAEEAVSYYETE